jgi:hypothetical protein
MYNMNPYHEKQNNQTYNEKTRPYMIEHHDQIEALRDEMKKKIPCALRKYIFDCECGARVGFHTFRFHLATAKHRKICGDLPPPIKRSDDVIEN